jgi:NAD(P)-dependent dehydrogenase (short-subunit alcohol dehydrogenase family)
MAANARIIVLTGATRGLGRALTDRFAEAGHTVLGCGRSAAGIEALRRAHGTPHDFAAVDVADADQVERWAAALVEGRGAPDLLINNAGLINRDGRLWELSAAEIGAVLDVNVKGTAHVIRAFAPAMIARGRGVIANLSSGWGRSVAPGVAPYCASKWAVEGLSQALAEELPAGVAAVAVNPGVIDTDMLRSCFGDSAAGYPNAEEWSRRAAPFFLGLGPDSNGRSLTVA